MKTTGVSAARSREGFTVVEVLIGLFVFVLVSAGALWGLNQLNYYASVNRLYTAAQTLAQNQIDQILTKGPYTASPSATPSPNVLQLGTYYTDPRNPLFTYGTAQSVPIYYYTSGVSTVSVVMGTIATTVANQTASVGGTNLNLRKATVVVTYTFRNKTFTVKMDTIRAPDA
jgi:type II secretory pathway pseudopilin PulG